jgi:hypothetical protein
MYGALSAGLQIGLGGPRARCRGQQNGLTEPSADHLASEHAPKRLLSHQPLNRAASHRHAFAVELAPNLVGAVGLHVGLPHALDLRHQARVTLGAKRAQRRIALTGQSA